MTTKFSLRDHVVLLVDTPNPMSVNNAIAKFIQYHSSHNNLCSRVLDEVTFNGITYNTRQMRRLSESDEAQNLVEAVFNQMSQVSTKPLEELQEYLNTTDKNFLRNNKDELKKFNHLLNTAFQWAERPDKSTLSVWFSEKAPANAIHSHNNDPNIFEIQWIERAIETKGGMFELTKAHDPWVSIVYLPESNVQSPAHRQVIINEDRNSEEDYEEDPDDEED